MCYLQGWILGNFLHAPSCLREAEQAKNKKFFNRKKAVFEWNEMMFCLLGKEVKKNLYQSGTYVYALLEHHCSFSSLKSLRWNSDSDYFDRPVRRKWSRFASSDLSLYNNYIQLAALVKEEINARPIFSRFIVALRRCIRKLFFLLKNIFCCLNIHRKEATENGSLP